MTEYSLHMDIKEWYSGASNQVEVKVDDFIIDVINKEGLLIEIQTRNLSAIKNKLRKLLEENKVRLVYPIAKMKWIVHVSESGEFIRKRKSPKKGKLTDLFVELVHLPSLMIHENFSFEVLLIEEEETRSDDGKGSWRRKGISIKDRKLVKIFDRVVFENKTDFLKILPKDLDENFTNKILAKKMGISNRLAQKITYCLRKMNVLTVVGKKRRELILKIVKEREG
jgi:ribosomal protein S25